MSPFQAAQTPAACCFYLYIGNIFFDLSDGNFMTAVHHANKRDARYLD